jgi:hypothetical protein
MTTNLGQTVGIRNTLRPTYVWVAFAAAALAVLSGSILAGAGHPGAFAPAIITAAFVLSLALPWRASLLAVPLLLLVEGLARRYLVNQVELFFVKDVVLAVAYAKYIVERRRAGLSLVPRSPVTWPLAAFAAIVVAGAFNPTLPSPIIGLFGIYSWLWYVPICWLVRDAFPTPLAAIRAVAAYLAIFVPLGVLAQVQQHVPAANRSYYDLEVGSTNFVYDGRIIASRSVATFASTNAFGDYLVIVAVLLFACALVVRRARTFLALAVVLAAFVLAVGGSGNRSASGAAFVSLIAVLALHKRLDRGAAAAATLGVAFMLALALLPPVLPGLDRAGGAGFSRASISQRLTAHLFLPIERILGVHWSETPTSVQVPTTTGKAGPVAPPAPPRASTSGVTAILGHGSGLGAGGLQYVANRFLSPSETWRMRALGGPEGGWADVLWELGPVGLVPLIWLFGAVTAVAIRVRRSTQDAVTQSVAAVGLAALASTAFLMLVTSKLTHPIYSVLFWFAVGLTLAADRFSRETA